MPNKRIMPHQRQAAMFLAERRNALLADGMRVGKTASAICACDLLGAKNILWLTRGAARREHEAAWRDYQRIDRPINVIENGKSIVGDGVTICSYDLAAGAMFFALEGRHYDVLVLDESHRLKSRDAKRTKTVYGANCDGSGLVSNAEYVWHLSGTPAPNHPGELWPMLRATMADAITPDGSLRPIPYWSFVSKYCATKTNYLGHLEIIGGGKNIPALKDAMTPYVLRRVIEDVMADMPKLTVDVLPLSGKLTIPRGIDIDIEEINRVLDEHGVEGLARVEKRATVLRRVTGLAKVKPMATWVAERLEDNEEKIVLFAHHVEVVEALMAELAEFFPVALYGGATAKQKQSAVPTFREDKNCRVFIGNIMSAGEAIDLSVADELIMVESSWVPGENEQACMRVVNMAKNRPTLARFATLAGSYDERIAESCAAKTRTIRELFS